VIVDNNLGARAALDHLYSLGHRKIAFIRGPRQLSDTEPRWRGVRTMAGERNLELEPAADRRPAGVARTRSPVSRRLQADGELLRRRRSFTALMPLTI